jgi:hypothetical protein
MQEQRFPAQTLTIGLGQAQTNPPSFSNGMMGNHPELWLGGIDGTQALLQHSINSLQISYQQMLEYTPEETHPDLMGLDIMGSDMIRGLIILSVSTVA